MAGVVSVLRGTVKSAAVPISVGEKRVGRYQRDVEAAVYFTILEALQNVAKHSEADSVFLSLSETAGDLGFEVRDDGCGFDMASVIGGGMGLAGLADRLDSLGGEVRVESTPGHGTTVTGSVPAFVSP